MKENHHYIINEKTFRQAYDSYYELVCRFLSYYTQDAQIIEEVVQDVFLKLWEDRAELKIEYLKTFLYKCARNKMLNYLRNEQNRTLLMEKWALTELEDQQASDCVDRDEFLFVLQAAVDELPDKCKEIYIMSREESLSYKEIATIKAISIKTVEAQMGIALKRIRENLANYYGEKSSLILLIFLHNTIS